jgi:hypothetical protein
MNFHNLKACTGFVLQDVILHNVNLVCMCWLAFKGGSQHSFSKEKREKKKALTQADWAVRHQKETE